MLPTIEDRDRVATAAQRDRRRVLGQPGIPNKRASSARRASLDSPLIDSPIDRLSAPSRTGDGIRAFGEFECYRHRVGLVRLPALC